MEKRLTAQGPKDRKSYTVTLPIEWIKSQKLEEDRQVSLNISGSKIIISGKNTDNRSYQINVDDFKDSMLKVFQGLYRVGISTLKVYFSNPEHLDIMMHYCEKRLIGYEVIEHNSDYIIIKDITKESQESFSNVLRRVFRLIIELSHTQNVIQLKTIDKNIKKLSNYAQRILIKEGHEFQEKISLYYLLLDRLEKIADELKWIRVIINQGGEEPEEFSLLVNYLSNAYSVFYKFDAELFNKSQSESNKTRMEVINTDQKTGKMGMHIYALSRLINSLYGDVYCIKGIM